jgi:hypothetical protein
LENILRKTKTDFPKNKLGSSCKAQNYWVFGLFPSPGILGTIKHDVSETGTVSVLR